jgi:hypothetical protein
LKSSEFADDRLKESQAQNRREEWNGRIADRCESGSCSQECGAPLDALPDLSYPAEKQAKATGTDKVSVPSENRDTGKS